MLEIMMILKIEKFNYNIYFLNYNINDNILIDIYISL